MYPAVLASCCFFHIGQSLYRGVQQEGLETQYNDPDDRTLKEYVHMILSLAFVPVEDAESTFDSSRDACPDEFYL